MVGKGKYRPDATGDEFAATAKGRYHIQIEKSTITTQVAALLAKITQPPSGQYKNQAKRHQTLQLQHPGLTFEGLIR